jgi:hypothetical protein
MISYRQSSPAPEIAACQYQREALRSFESKPATCCCDDAPGRSDALQMMFASNSFTSRWRKHFPTSYHLSACGPRHRELSHKAARANPDRKVIPAGRSNAAACWLLALKALGYENVRLYDGFGPSGIAFSAYRWSSAKADSDSSRRGRLSPTRTFVPPAVG